MSDQQEHEESARTVDRRRLLRRAGTVAAGVAGAGVVTSVAAAPAEADPGGNVVMADTNDAGGNTTGITNNRQTGATLRLTNNFKDSNGLTGAALQLEPISIGLTPATPPGSIAADLNGVFWSSVQFDGVGFESFLYNSAVANHLVPLSTPQRVLDTRTAAGRVNLISPGGNLDGTGRVLAGRTVNLDLVNYVFGGVALFANVTVASPAVTSFLTVYPWGSPRPATSTVNFNANQILSNFTVCALGFDPVDFDPFDAISIYCNGTTHVIVDVTAFVVGSPDQVLAGLAAPSTLSSAAATSAQTARQQRTAARLRQLRTQK
jgi:hypothetical protein